MTNCRLYYLAIVLAMYSRTDFLSVAQTFCQSDRLGSPWSEKVWY